MSAEIHFVCSECGCHSEEDALGWRAEIVRTESDEDQLVFLCPDCAPED